MSKPYTETDLVNQITADRTWRLQEISDLKSLAKRSDPTLQRVLLRAMITLNYAHWEGSVKFAAKKFLEHVSLRKLPYRALDRQFLRNYFLPRLASNSVTSMSLADRCRLIDEILSSDEERFSRPNNDVVNTQSNLNSYVVADICLVCGVRRQII